MIFSTTQMGKYTSGNKILTCQLMFVNKKKKSNPIFTLDFMTFEFCLN